MDSFRFYTMCGHTRHDPDRGEFAVYVPEGAVIYDVVDYCPRCLPVVSVDRPRAPRAPRLPFPSNDGA